MWSYRDRTEEDAKELSKALKRAGFRFVGPTTVYAAMQACGIVNDHRPDCWVRDDVERQRTAAFAV
jgi:3-methyladenine DNA glycosylase